MSRKEINKRDDLGEVWEIQYNLNRIKTLALEIADNKEVDVTPTAQAEIISKMVDETKGLLSIG